MLWKKHFEYYFLHFFKSLMFGANTPRVVLKQRYKKEYVQQIGHLVSVVCFTKNLNLDVLFQFLWFGYMIYCLALDHAIKGTPVSSLKGHRPAFSSLYISCVFTHTLLHPETLSLKNTGFVFFLLKDYSSSVMIELFSLVNCLTTKKHNYSCEVTITHGARDMPVLLTAPCLHPQKLSVQIFPIPVNTTAD